MSGGNGRGGKRGQVAGGAPQVVVHVLILSGRGNVSIHSHFLLQVNGQTCTCVHMQTHESSLK